MTSRFHSRPLYNFALYSPAPPLEKLLLIMIASSIRFVERGGSWPSESELQYQTGVSSEAVEKALCSLVKSGLVDEIKVGVDGAVFAIPPALPILYEYRYDFLFFNESELGACSNEIRALLRLDEISVEELKKEKPGLRYFLEAWERGEKERAQSRAKGKIGPKNSTELNKE